MNAITQSSLAGLLGVSTLEIAQWESGEVGAITPEVLAAALNTVVPDCW
jgi:transcriptional regulator with XRE-family HTH domain